MSKIKICGITTIDEIKMMNVLKPDYIGFVFAPSKRQVSLAQAMALRSHLDPGIQVVGVFVDMEIEQLAAVTVDVGLDLIQLHGQEDESYCQMIQEHIGLPIIKAIGVSHGGEWQERGAYSTYRLFDTHVKGKIGGTGIAFDWTFLRGYPYPYFLAGGICRENIDEALSYNPYCVDVSSGVEEGGQKAFHKVAEIIKKVRQDYV